MASSAPMWDRRTLTGSKPMPVASFYPLIGRGNVNHALVSHDELEIACNRSSRLSVVERIRRFAGV